ncbi:MAG: XdhC family protein [Synergistaceae bacterium]|jgi:xanthine dehydrogenase accessory factor|nr:XdhC family protein [Synergistaceae bacterium]
MENMKMENMKRVYCELFQNLQEGQDTVLVTVIEPSGLEKTLHTGASVAYWTNKWDNSYSLYAKESKGEIVVVEHFLPSQRLIVFGGGHIAMPLSEMASLLKFKVTVFDDRPFFADRTRFPNASEVICESFERVSQRLTFWGNDYVAIMTRGHRHDIECLRSVLSSETFPLYVGMIGSRRRVALVRRQMKEEGFSPERLERLHAPIGLDIGAVSPEEIALSILAEIVREKRGGISRKRECHANMELMQLLGGTAKEGTEERIAVITVVSAKGSTPREAGAKMAVFYDGRTVGSIGGGCAEADVARDARQVILEGGYRLKTIDMEDLAEEDGMACGGKMEVLMEAL